MATDWRFDTQELFGDDYLFFYSSMLTDEVSDRQTDLIWRLLELEPGAQVLDLAWEGRFDAVTCVFTSFGYFDDDDNRRVLRAVRRALRPGGRLYLDLNHLPWLLANVRDREVAERGGPAVRS